MPAPIATKGQETQALGLINFSGDKLLPEASHDGVYQRCSASNSDLAVSSSLEALANGGGFRAMDSDQIE